MEMNGIKKILKERNYKAGYVVRTMLMEGEEYGTEDYESTAAFTPSGDYIGNSKDAYRLCKKRGIKPEIIDADDSVCSIGFSEKEQKWYGWSHRAIYGYGVGDVVEEGTCPTESGFIDEYIAEHPEKDRSVPAGFEVKNLEDAKRVAIAFADSVS